jgi:molybdenum cofactor cytidylyltransferase
MINDGIILLAAGSSSRMGRSKQLLSIQGRSLLQLSAEAAIGSGARKVMVVLGSQAEEHRKALAHLRVSNVINTEWQKGMGGSIKSGLAELLQFSRELTSVIVMVCDQPAITAAHLIELRNKYAELNSPVVASLYANAPGVPVLFDHTLFSDIFHIGDEHGAKKILSRHARSIVTVDFPGGEIDLDTPEEFDDYIKKL